MRVCTVSGTYARRGVSFPSAASLAARIIKTGEEDEDEEEDTGGRYERS